MNFSEFKAWFSGFTEGFDAAPSENQWARIMERVGEIIEAPPMPYPVFVQRYHYVQPYYPQPFWGPIWTGGVGIGSTSVLQQPNSIGMNAAEPAPEHSIGFSSGYTAAGAFQALGRADAALLN